MHVLRFLLMIREHKDTMIFISGICSVQSHQFLSVKFITLENGLQAELT